MVTPRRISEGATSTDYGDPVSVDPFDDARQWRSLRCDDAHPLAPWRSLHPWQRLNWSHWSCAGSSFTRVAVQVEAHRQESNQGDDDYRPIVFHRFTPLKQ